MQKFWIGCCAAFLLFMGWVVLNADRGSLPDLVSRLYAFPEGDKLGHFILMGCMALLANLAWGRKTFPFFKVKLYLGSTLVALVVAAEAYSQRFFAGRHSSLADLSASFLGIVLIGSLLPWALSRCKTGWFF